MPVSKMKNNTNICYHSIFYFQSNETSETTFFKSALWTPLPEIKINHKIVTFKKENNTNTSIKHHNFTQSPKTFNAPSD